MSFEAQLDALLKTFCLRTFPDVAPLGTAAPYLTWQQLGGESLRFLDNTAADRRNVLLQISCYAETRLIATTLIRQIEEDLCVSLAFTALPEGEAMSVYESDTRLFGSIQRYSIFAQR